MKTPKWRIDGKVAYIMPFLDAGLVTPMGKKWKAILLTMTDQYHMGMQGMKRQIYRFSSPENAMKCLDMHVRQLHPEVKEIQQADETWSVSPTEGAEPGR